MRLAHVVRTYSKHVCRVGKFGMPVVVMCEEAPREEEWIHLAKYPRNSLFFVQGLFGNYQDLLRAGIDRAAFAVFLSPCTGASAASMDADVVTCILEIRNKIPPEVSRLCLLALSCYLLHCLAECWVPFR